MDPEPRYYTCIACQRGKHDKCWVRWADHSANPPQQWRCDCWDCTVKDYIRAEGEGFVEQ